MQIAVCDDNEMCLRELMRQLQSMPMAEGVFAFSDLSAFLCDVEGGSFYDAVLMDIDWGRDGSGIDAAEELYKISPNMKVIYVTGYGERYNQQIFLRRANLSGFLTKPVDGALLEANLRKVAAAAGAGADQPSILLRRRGGAVTIPLNDIYYIESRGRTIETHTSGEVVVSYEKLGNVIPSLPAWFIQCHKSYVINMRQIQRFRPDGILLKCGDAVPASRSKYAKAKEAYFRYMGNAIL